MNKKPGVFWHMMSWGAVSGTILGTLFLMFFLLFGASIGEVFSGLLILLIPALIFGGIPGAIIGFIESFFAKRALRDIPEPFTKDDMKDRRWALYRAVFPVPIAFSIILSSFLWFMSGEALVILGYWFIFGIPTIIASIASAYVAHRYLFRLRLWSEKHYARKPKAKNSQIDVNHLLEHESADSMIELEDKSPAQKRNRIE